MSIIQKSSKHNVVELLVSLMKIESTTGNEKIICEELSKFMEENNWFVRKQFIENTDGRCNLLITKNGVELKDIKFLFNSHLDTVPPYIPPRINNDIVYGRGSNDAKGQVSAMIAAAEKLSECYPELVKKIGLLFVVGEETDHIGMITANEFDLKPDYMVIGEPTENIFANIQKGAAKLEIHCKGKAAHSGYPEKGESAIEKLLDILQDIRKFNWPKNEIIGNTTVNIGFIKGGQALNALAAEASAKLMFRITTSTKDIYEKLTSIVGGRGKIKLIGSNEPVELSEAPPGYKSQSVSFNTDLPYFENRQFLKGVYLYGAGSITNAHSVDEHIKIKDLDNAVYTYIDLVKHSLKNC
uniref:M20_dimer domain-containing protein n=1 Tax=Parastrongyloides trichosuri TaxID=131310 RepID=A0A0N4ZFZ8_PARTI